MTSLTPQSRSIIDAARDADELDDVARARMKRRIVAHVAAGAAAAGATAAAVQAAAATKAAGGVAGAGLLAKLGVSLVLAGVVGLGSYQAVTSSSPVTPPAFVEAPAPPPVTPTEPAAKEPVVEEEETATDEAVEAVPQATPPEEAPAQVAPVAKPPASSLAAETALLRRAQNELQSGNPDKALELLDKHGSDHESGALREERLAARVLALCSAGRADEARAQAQRFAAEFPRSVHKARVLSACATK